MFLAVLACIRLNPVPRNLTIMLKHVLAPKGEFAPNPIDLPKVKKTQLIIFGIKKIQI